MKYCLPKSELYNIFLLKVKANAIKTYLNPTSVADLKEQINKDAKRFANNPSVSEIYSALYLSDFYFGPEVETKICFDMKSGFNPKDYRSIGYDELENWIDTYTAIDCYISHEDKEIKFQIKRFPEPWKIISTSEITKYIKEDLSKKYGNMTDIILVLIPQPAILYTYLPVDWDELSDLLKRPRPNFKEIVFLVNIVGKGVALHKAYTVD